MTRIFIRVTTTTLKGFEWVGVNAYLVTAPWAKGCNLFVHKHNKQKGSWTVTEARCGQSLATASSKENAIETARKRMEQVGKETFQETVEKSIVEFELSPLFTSSLGLDFWAMNKEKEPTNGN
uniref:Uncharacterized protein n=1 Tax=viral metagenome TaxID=1070528 RepID=A0A6M3IPQ7_9ZZZZ